MLAFTVCITVSLNLLWAFPVHGAVDYSTVRVMLSSLGTPSSVSIIIEGAYRLTGRDIPLASGTAYTLSRRGDDIVLSDGGQEWNLGGRCFFERQDASFSTGIRVCNTAYGWCHYLGNMEVRPAESGLCLINHIYLEQYLYGVVPYAMNEAWPLEALKSQAVAARTYAVRCKAPVAEYDLGDTASHQIYKGFDASKARSIQAVDETAGQVVAWQEGFAGTYYTPSNGGRIQSAANHWGVFLPYSVVKDDPYDAANPQNPHRAWSVSYNRLSVDPELESRLIPHIREALSARGYRDGAGDIDILQIKSMNAGPADESGRRRSVSLSLMVQARRRQGGELETVEQPVEIAAGDIQNVLGVKSLLFTVETTDEQCTIIGSGKGHGIGMSQYGARQMAEEGFTAADILAFYFPGTELQTLSLRAPELPGDPGEAAWDAEMAHTGDSYAEENRYGTVEVTTSLNVRQGPGLQYQKTGSLADGTRVRILLAGEEWTQIQAGDLMGYVYSANIRPDTPAEQNPTPEPAQQEEPHEEVAAPPPDKNRQREVVTASALFVRSGPSTKNHQMGLCVPGASEQPPLRAGEWFQIAYSDSEGYQYSQNIRILRPGEKKKVSGTGITTAEWLNVRTGPGIQYPRSDRLREGTEVEILAVEGEWCQIRYDGQTGYGYAGYISQIPENSEGGIPMRLTGIVNAPRINVRSGPSLWSDRMGSLQKGEVIQIRGAEDGWYFFNYQGVQAYVHAGFITVSGRPTARVTASSLNIRSGPGNLHPVSGRLRAGSTVTVLSETRDWTAILQGDGMGYVYSAYLEKLSG